MSYPTAFPPTLYMKMSAKGDSIAHLNLVNVSRLWDICRILTWWKAAVTTTKAAWEHTTETYI